MTLVMVRKIFVTPNARTRRDHHEEEISVHNDCEKQSVGYQMHKDHDLPLCFQLLFDSLLILLIITGFAQRFIVKIS